MKTSILITIAAFWLSSFTNDSVNKENIIYADSTYNPKENLQTVVVWFEDQYLEAGDSFLKKTETFHGRKRGEVRTEVMLALKTLSNTSFSKIKSNLNALESANQVSGIKQHWIINGFTCTVTTEGLKTIKTLEGVDKIFVKRTRSTSKRKDMGPEFIANKPASRFAVKTVASYPWNIEKIRAPEVWTEFGITGKGTLNIVHDSGFKLDVPALAETIYTNDGEIPGNGLDDDNNGFIDDYHGYNFDSGLANLNEPSIKRGTNIHGNMCAALISGTFETNTKQAVGIAPESQWAPIIGSSNIEQAVEWAIEQGADTYSMSFSQPNLGEFRTHWRKVLEQGTLCGVVFISGAGNFASGSKAAPVPVQMRNPEDIPNAVLGVAGVGEDGKRPVFSSQGPVEWNTDYYKEGTVNKPDFATFNANVPCIDPEGNLTNIANGNSFSSPHMAGIVSLMFSANPDLLPWEIKEILLKTAEDIGDKGFDYQSGNGFVNAYDAVKAVMEL
ncbi:S8 family serine peptidase [Algibacter miyuki]|uniref:S8 family serine peptidase n=1 Tax=Algibacter miyuki TaxID=1306933 RepID=A0ABV5GWL3_9FLAO|nr:S8 family serine peptidase [Algibacter miyuki]MDN3665220.1 S8 family serine peptidase [Algibacter miyuki]